MKRGEGGKTCLRRGGKGRDERRGRRDERVGDRYGGGEREDRGERGENGGGVTRKDG